MSNEFDLGGDGIPSFPFEKPGDEVVGNVLDLTELQQRDISDGSLKFWPDGKPQMMFRVVLQTELRDDEFDDGKRSVYPKGSRKPESESSLAALLAAVRKATGRTHIAVGGQLSLRYVGDGKRKTSGHNPPKRYVARYVPPTQAVDLDEQTPESTVVVEPTPAEVIEDLDKKLRELGLDPEKFRPKAVSVLPAEAPY
jgi:hypothetical protein